MWTPEMNDIAHMYNWLASGARAVAGESSLNPNTTAVYERFLDGAICLGVRATWLAVVRHEGVQTDYLDRHIRPALEETVED